jgi:hypothetical protein
LSGRGTPLLNPFSWAKGWIVPFWQRADESTANEKCEYQGAGYD